MSQKSIQLVMLVCSLLALNSCAKVNLQGNKPGSNPAVGSNPGQLTGQQQITGAAAQSSPPPLDGEWEFDYEFKGNPYIGSVQLVQKGTALEGQGADQDGKEWQLESGLIEGTKVSFQKKYIASSSPGIAYSGELKYLESPEFTGWMMEGSYNSAGPNGQSITGNWVANPKTALAAPAQEAPAQPAGLSLTQVVGAPAQTQAGSSSSDNLGDIKPADISGRYDCSYTYNFKKIKSSMWLRNEGKKVSGDGVDIIDKTSERFTIPRGWYDYPKVTLVRQYTKGAGAKESRTITFKAELSSNGRDIAMKGETQYGGQWKAKLLR
ncbi:MAG: hypothetical protein K2X27_07925 [Candidatus Obscuribacterales bacterium]|nr:hypothetical protein [Candidatus Obscuribacterales bacterium]